MPSRAIRSLVSPKSGRPYGLIAGALAQRAVGAPKRGCLGTIAVGVLDLYAGTGALGIEALSRGSGHAVFVEHDQLVALAGKTEILRPFGRRGGRLRERGRDQSPGI